MAYTIEFHRFTIKDRKHIPVNIRKGIVNAIENRLAIDPVNYGTRSRKSLKGYWKMRIGSYRVIYEIKGSRIIVHGIGHRDIYMMLCFQGFLLHKEVVKAFYKKRGLSRPLEEDENFNKGRGLSRPLEEDKNFNKGRGLSRSSMEGRDVSQN